MRRRTFWVCLLVLGMVVIPKLARAEHTRFWRETDYAQFEKGDAKGVALRSDGKLMPAPHFAEYSDPNLAYVWALRTDTQGRLYAAGGSDAKVLRFDNPSKPTTVFESSELTAQAIAFDSHNNLYVGTSPDGKVYKVAPDGQRSTFFEPKTKYIWALAVDSSGTVFVGTGDAGEVFAVAPDGAGKVFYKTQERHARSLAFDNKGNLLIGTDPNGLVVRVGIQHKGAKDPVDAGSAFVLFETEKKEVTSLLADKSGNVYVSAVGDKARGQENLPPLTQNPTVTITTSSSPIPGAPTIVSQGPMPQGIVGFPFNALAGGADVIRIGPDDSPEKIWSSHDDMVYSMALSSANKLLLGIGNNGGIIQLEGEDLFSRIAKTASSQVTAFAQGAGGSIYVATANPGKIFELGSGYDKGGTFQSDPFDAKIFSHWGRITWWGENGANDGKVTFYVRSGNTSRPEENWSDWSGPYSKASGDITSPPARFVQWKAVFVDADSAAPPAISWVNIAYQPKNVAPAIDDIAIQASGVRVVGFPGQQPGPGSPSPVQLEMPQKNAEGANSGANSGDFRQPRIEVPPQGFEDKGYESVLWSAHDDNDDDLTYTIFYRAEGDKEWRLLKDKINHRYYSWDATSMPDGAYYLKIVASDSPSNPADQALSGSKESERFEVDNTPPTISNIRAEATPGSKGDYRVLFEAADAHSDLSRAEYCLDSDSWEMIYPVGLLTDAPHESYQVELHALAAGEHTVAVRITDRFGNVSASQVTFSVPPR